MEICNIKILRGPNYWSDTRHKLIILRIDLKEYENYPTDTLPGFNESLKALMPSLYNHYCSPNEEGGFFKRLSEGTWLGHVIEHIALELQWLAGMKCSFGRTRPTGKIGVYNVVFSYEIENAGIFAAKTAFKIAKLLAKGKQYTSLAADIAKLKNIFQLERLGLSTEAIVSEAKKRNIPFKRLNDRSLVMLGQGCHQKIICATITHATSCLGVDLVGDKDATKMLLSSEFIPVPSGAVVKTLKELKEKISELKFPIVIKPLCSNHGKGITTQIMNKEKAILAYKLAKKFGEQVIIENYVKGEDYRLLVINFKLIAAANRQHARVVGTGNATIRELIELTNSHPDRGEGHDNYLSKIKIDDATRVLLEEQGLSLESIPREEQVVLLKSSANLSTGGTAVDVTDQVHPENKALAERIARLVNLDICGIDLIAQDISLPINEKTGAILEVNASPGLRMHLAPTKGEPRNVAKPIVDMLYPKGALSRIPIISVTGTNGKTTIVRLIAYFAAKAGYTVGCTTTDGIYINNHEVTQGDCSGPASAFTVLRDPAVNFAVLECARGGILRSGLGFDYCNVSILSNVASDHLGQDDIYTLEQMARVKSVVPFSTFDHGYSILNADDDLVFAMKEKLLCNVALFSMNADNPRILDHCAQGGIAAYVKSEWFIFQHGNQVNKFARIKDIPLTFEGYATCMVKNILPALLAGYVNSFSLDDMRQWLHTFHPTNENIPGRMNLFHFPNCRVLIDYAHNEDAFIELRDFIKKIDSHKKVGIIAATGDRLPSDIKKVGYYAAQTFDEIIIRQDSDSRGRTHEELNELILEGIHQVNHHSKVKIIPNEFHAIQFALDHAEEDTFIMYFPDKILQAIAYVKCAAEKSNSKIYQE